MSKTEEAVQNMDIRYEVKTKHSNEMLKKYVQFQYNALMPTKRFQSILTILVLVAVSLFMPNNLWRWLFLAFAVIMLINVLTGPARETGALKRSDPSYIHQSVITYHFLGDKVEMETPELKEKLRFAYSDISEIYMDDNFFYIRIQGEGIHMFSRQEITIGDPDRMGEFLKTQTGLPMRWAKLTLKQVIAVMQGKKIEYDEDKRLAKEKAKSKVKREEDTEKSGTSE